MFPQGSRSLKINLHWAHVGIRFNLIKKINPPLVNNLCDHFAIYPLWTLVVFLSSPPFHSADHTFPLDCLPFWGTFATSDSDCHPLHTAMFWEVPNLPGTSCYLKIPLVPKKRVAFKLFLDSLNIKILSTHWPFQLVKVKGNTIPLVHFNIFGPKGLSNKNIELLSFSAR